MYCVHTFFIHIFSFALYCVHIEIILFIGSQPPPPDAINTSAEFSHTHYARDDDLISLQIEPHRLVFLVTIVSYFAMLLIIFPSMYRISSNKSPGVYFVQLTFSKASI